MIEIFKAEIFDLQALTVMFNKYRMFYKQPSDEEGCRTFLYKRLALNDSVIYIARDEVNIAGFVQLYPIFSSVQMKKMWLLNDLYVMEEFRRTGIARKLIEASELLAKETQSAGLLLETSKMNIEGNHLYLSAGFKLSDNNFYFRETK